MRTNRTSAIAIPATLPQAITEWIGGAPVHGSPLRRRTGPSLPSRVAATLVTVRQFLQAIEKRRRTPPTQDGGPLVSLPEAVDDAHRDDPALWMLMWH
jgi:hypothetical protein